MNNNLIKEAIADANAVQAVAEERAKSMLIKEFSPRIKSALASLINEDGVSTGSDQPGGYNPEEDQDAVGATVPAGQTSDNLSLEGDGPEKIQEDDDLPVDDKEEPVLEGEEEDDDDAELTDEEIDPLVDVPDKIKASNAEKTDVIEIVDDMDTDEPADTGEVPPSVDEEFPPVEDGGDEVPKDDEMYENLRKKYRRLASENKTLRETVSILHNKFKKIDLFNAKLAYAFKLMSRPGLTRNQKRQIAETFDSAKSVREAQLIYRTLKSGIATPATPKKVLENKNVKSVISESTKSNGAYNRLNELAGI